MIFFKSLLSKINELLRNGEVPTIFPGAEAFFRAFLSGAIENMIAKYLNSLKKERSSHSPPKCGLNYV